MFAAPVTGRGRYDLRSRLQNALKDKIVLVIEDDPILLRTLARSFHLHGCQVMAAQDGSQGLEKFRHLRPDVVVTDIIMPNREGVETILAMKELAPEVKILAISGGGRLASGELLNLARSLGADAVLPKPFRAAELVDAVCRLIDVSAVDN